MKELSIEEKATRYDLAIEVAEKYHNGTLKDVMETIFPELQESEDEKIMKWIRKELESKYVVDNIVNNVMADKALAWLEKQGSQILANSCKTCKDEQTTTDVRTIGYWYVEDVEQKSADKVEPFNEYEGLTDFERTLTDICIGWIGEEHGWKQYIKDNADVLLKIAIKKFNSVQDVPFDQKPAWSEEEFAHIVGCLVQDIVANEHMPEEEKQPTKFFVEKYYKKLREE